MYRSQLVSLTSQNLYPAISHAGQASTKDDTDTVKAWLAANKSKLKNKFVYQIVVMLLTNADAAIQKAATNLTKLEELETLIEDWCGANDVKLERRMIVFDASKAPKNKFTATASGFGKSVEVNTKLSSTGSMTFRMRNGFSLTDRLSYGVKGDKDRNVTRKLSFGAAGKLIVTHFELTGYIGADLTDKNGQQSSKLSYSGGLKYNIPYSRMYGLVTYDKSSGYMLLTGYSTRDGIHSLSLGVGFDDRLGPSSFMTTYGLKLPFGKKAWSAQLKVNPKFGQPFVRSLSVGVNYAF